MKVGIKLYPQRLEYGQQFKDTADFFEVMVLSGFKYEPFLNLGKELSVHIPHCEHGFNIADKSKKQFNIGILNNCLEVADRLKSDKVVLHPGIIENDNCSEENSFHFLDDFRSENRILIENLCYQTRGFKHVGFSFEQVKKISDEFKFGICMDFAHAATVAHNLGFDYKEYIKKFMKLSAHYFHLSDLFVESGKDQHLNLGEGNMNVDFIKSLIKSDDYVALETPIKEKIQKQEIEVLRR